MFTGKKDIKQLCYKHLHKVGYYVNRINLKQKDKCCLDMIMYLFTLKSNKLKEYIFYCVCKSYYVYIILCKLIQVVLYLGTFHKL